ncbi:hypothetical protein [Pseudochrobactrum kiredjianiae]|uniref:hypothetical protein n=1 Tax=Pseudochrobactrum kiredjianiae TaxID=386305 RepID=UPI0025A152B3|nr:hypothetical protein [Pseudochrobactrum kiredjianiae]
MLKHIEFIKEEIQAELKRRKVAHDEGNIPKNDTLIASTTNIIKCFNCDRPTSSASFHSLCAYCAFIE